MAKKKAPQVRARVIKVNEPVEQEMNIKKADSSTQIEKEGEYNAGEWITPPVELEGFKALVSESSILPQCIRAYKNNIAGFGIGVRYIDDVQETPEMAEEYSRAEKIVDLLNVEQDTKEVFEDIIEAREIYGIAYLEVIRNLDGEVQQIDFIKDTPSIRKTLPLEPYVSTSYYYKGEEVVRRKKFRKYKQQVGGKVVFFKEFGDLRIMDNRNGEYASEGNEIDLQYRANEILEFTIGTESYGEIRWMGQLLGVDGSRAAENLNNNYFRNGRHTPLMIMVKGGSLTDESFTKLQEYMNDIKGEAGQHSFLVLETENVDGRADFDDAQKPEIEVKDLASILQKDELFQDYLENNRKRVQSSFLLPDLYVGYTTDFNRATAQMAMEVTEEQVFQPERNSLAWAVNNKLLNSYRFRYVEVYFLAPDISNPDDLYKILTVAKNAGGLTPNLAKEIVCNAIGRTSEPYTEEWGDIPIDIYLKENGANNNMQNIVSQLSGQIEKAQKQNEPDEIVVVMKEVRRLLSEIKEGENEDKNQE